MEWDPSRFFGATGSPTPYALLVLHQPINEKAFGVLSKHASYIICADGGSNRFYDMMKAEGTEFKNLPDAIMGDLDSIRPTVREHYEKLGVLVIQDPDQYSTDFTKCLNYLNAHAAEIIACPRQGKSITASEAAATPQTNQSPLEIVVLGGLGGRVDQAFSQVHHLYMMTQTQRKIRESQCNGSSSDHNRSAGGNLYLVSEESITFIIQRGKNIIYTPATNRGHVASPEPEVDETPSAKKGEIDQGPEPEYLFEENIGIIPLTAPAIITTHGFEWDVENWRTEIGGQISTSNHIRADQVEVETSADVLFTLELAERLKRRS